MLRRKSVGYIMAVLFASTALMGQARAEAEGTLGQARAMGVANSFTAVATGIRAMAWNPANLAAFDGPGFELLIFNFGADVRNNAWSIDTWNDAIEERATQNGGTRQVMTVEGLQGLLGELDGENWDGSATISVQHLPTMVLGNFGISFSSLVVVETEIPRDVLGLPVDDVPVGSPRSIDGLTANAWAAEAVNISYGREVKIDQLYDLGVDGVSLGVTAKIYLGIFYAGITEASGYFTAIQGDQAGFDVDAHVRYEISGEKNPGINGMGMGLDLGIAGTFRDKYKISAILRNIPIKALTFDLDEVRNYDLVNSQAPPLADIFNPDGDISFGDNIDSLFAPTGQAQIDTKTEGGTFSPDAIPSGFEVGAARDFLGGMIVLTGDWEQNFGNTSFGSTTPRISAGVEFKPINMFQFRGGMSVGGRSGNYSTLGFGFHPPGFHFDIGVAKRGGYIPLNVPFGASSKGYVFSMELGVGF